MDQRTSAYHRRAWPAAVRNHKDQWLLDSRFPAFAEAKLGFAQAGAGMTGTLWQAKR
jgi:hypothetical protein